MNVAVKRQEIVDPSLERYLLKELSILRRCKTQYVIGFYGAYREGSNIAYILTEYVEGGDLRRLLQDKSIPLGYKLRAEIAHACLEGLTYLHEREIIHRDIKTENVILDKNCSPKLCDFGFARKIHRGEPHMTMCGTDEFMAPEILFGMIYDEKVDIYSFGIMMSEVLTRNIPGKDTGFLDRLPQDGFGIKIDELDSEFTRVDCPVSLQLLTKEMLADAPESRPGAKDARDWINDFLKEQPDDTDPKPNLSGEEITEKLDEYISRLDEEIRQNSDIGHSSRPTTVFSKDKVKQALEERAALKAEAQGRANGATSVGSAAGAVAPAVVSTTIPIPANVKRGTAENKQLTVTVHDTNASASASVSGSPSKNAKRTSVAVGGRPPSQSISETFFDKISLCFRAIFHRDNKLGAAATEMPDWEKQVGWIMKRGGRVKTWKKRYMVLTALGIVYFRNEEANAEEAQGSIEFAEMTEIAGTVCTAVPTVMTGKPYSFGVHSLKRTYYMCAETEQERDKWIQSICEGYATFHNRKAKKGKKKT